jgi:hypothetical protein
MKIKKKKEKEKENEKRAGGLKPPTPEYSGSCFGVRLLLGKATWKHHFILCASRLHTPSEKQQSSDLTRGRILVGLKLKVVGFLRSACMASCQVVKLTKQLQAEILLYLGTRPPIATPFFFLSFLSVFFSDIPKAFRIPSLSS